MSVEVRPLVPDDWRTWREVRQLALRTDPHAFSAAAHRWLGPDDVERAWRDRLATTSTFVALVDDRPLASAAWDPAKRELVSMWVAPTLRGTGVAARLVAAVVEAAGEQAVVLRVMSDNAAAVRFYERQGFVLDGDGPDAEDTLGMTLTR